MCIQRFTLRMFIENIDVSINSESLRVSIAAENKFIHLRHLFLERVETDSSSARSYQM